MTRCQRPVHWRATIWVSDMAIVPPGNKQVGEYTGIATMVADGAIVVNTGEYVNALVYDPTTTYTPAAPKNVLVGEYTGIATLVSEGGYVANHGMGGLAVVYVDQTPATYNFGMASLVVVEADTPDPVIKSPLNVMVGEYTGIATLTQSGAVIANSGVSALVLVQKITPRIESIIMNLVYPGGG